MVENHAERFPNHAVADRLAQADLNPPAFRRLKNGLETDRVRESAIPEEDVEAAVQFLVDHPDVGAGKARASLINNEEAWLSTANLNDVKQMLKTATSQEYQKRKEEEKLLEAQLRQDLLSRRMEYGHFQARKPNHVWSMDFSRIVFLGTPFMLCEAYDEYSQAYLSLRADFHGDHGLAAATFQEAEERTGETPAFLRRDNGKPFLTEQFQQFLKDTEDCPVPPGSPWFNGSLESCHTSLKAAVKTTAMKDMAESPESFREARRDPADALKLLQSIVDRVRLTVNEDISRLKHNMPPGKVYRGEENEVRRIQSAFVEKKKMERAERMKAVRASPVGKRVHRTFVSKAKATIKKTIDGMRTNALYALNEALHRRYKLCET